MIINNVMHIRNLDAVRFQGRHLAVDVADTPKEVDKPSSEADLFRRSMHVAMHQYDAPFTFYHKLNKIQIDITANCNAACPLCARNIDGGSRPIDAIKTGENGNLVYETIITKVFTPEILSNLHCVEFDGNFGDSSHHPRLFDILKHIHKHNPSIIIDVSTNGGFRDEEWWAEFGKIQSTFNKFSRVVFGIDGVNNKTHQLYRRDVVYDKLLRNALAFIQNGGMASWKFIEFNHNSHQFDKARRLAKKYGFKNFETTSDRLIPQVTKKFADGTLDDKNSAEIDAVDTVGIKASKTKFHEEHAVVMGASKYNLSKERVSREQEYRVIPGYLETTDSALVPSKDLKNKATGTAEAENLTKQVLLHDYKDGQDYTDTVPIICKYREDKGSGGQDKQINIEWDGRVWPCCWMPHSMSYGKNCEKSAETFENYYIKKYGHDFNNIYKWSLEEILSHPFFNEDLEASWENTTTSSENPRLHICSHTCGKAHKKIEELYGGYGSRNNESFEEL